MNIFFASNGHCFQYWLSSFVPSLGKGIKFSELDFIRIGDRIREDEIYSVKIGGEHAWSFFPFCLKLDGRTSSISKEISNIHS